jgi:hypothetical protein
MRATPEPKWRRNAGAQSATAVGSGNMNAGFTGHSLASEA